MKVIGAGMPRTGTLTQKVALETLGFEPCYHWVNVIADLDQVDVWNRALDGGEQWDEVFGDSQATVDWPGGYFWHELMDYYPDAKVLLSVRDPEKWEPSFRETIWNMCYGESLIRLLSSARGQVDPRWARYLKLVERMFWIEQAPFADGHEQPEQLIAGSSATTSSSRRPCRPSDCSCGASAKAGSRCASSSKYPYPPSRCRTSTTARRFSGASSTARSAHFRRGVPVRSRKRPPPGRQPARPASRMPRRPSRCPESDSGHRRPA